MTSLKQRPRFRNKKSNPNTSLPGEERLYLMKILWTNLGLNELSLVLLMLVAFL